MGAVALIVAMKEEDNVIWKFDLIIEVFPVPCDHIAPDSGGCDRSRKSVVRPEKTIFLSDERAVMDAVARILQQKTRSGRRGSVSSMASRSTRGVTTREAGKNRWQALIEAFLTALRDISDRVPADDEIEIARRYLQELEDKTRTDHLRSINDTATTPPTEL